MNVPGFPDIYNLQNHIIIVFNFIDVIIVIATAAANTTTNTIIFFI